MKRILAFLMTVILILLLCACGETAAPADAENGEQNAAVSAADEDDVFHGEDNIKLTLWVPEALLTLSRELCDEFIASYSEKDIAIEVVAQGEADAAGKLIESPDAADVFSFPCDQTNRLMQHKLLTPVADAYLDDVKTRNFVFSLDSATQDDTLVAYPQTGENGYYLIYDKSCISDEEARSLEGILEACRKAKKKFVLDADKGFYACMFLFTGGLYTNGLTGGGKQILNAYNEDTVLDALEAFAALLHEYKDVFLSTETEEFCKLIAQSPSEIAAGIDGSWDADAVTKALGSNYGASKLPTVNIRGTDTQIFSINGSKLIGVNARSAFPNAAQALANYLTGKDCQKARLDTHNWLPSNTELLQSDTVRNSPTLSALAKQAEFSVPMINIADNFWDAVGALGHTVYAAEDYSRTALKQELEKIITAISGSTA